MNMITLKCFHCGKKQDVFYDGSISFAFQLINIANKAGMVGVVDNYHNRVVVFCNEECLNAEKTKKGTIRLRPIGVKNK